MINEVFRKKSDSTFLDQYIRSIKKDDTIIEINDYGAGSRKKHGNLRAVKKIYSTSSSGPKKADLIRRICEYEREEFTILELGTNLGVTTLALSLSKKCNEVISIEGCPNLYTYTKGKLEEYKNIQLINGQFDDHLENILNLKKPNILYIDGNHTYEATLRYFDIISKFSEVDLILFDDIHWSKGMEKAWNEIAEKPEFHVSIDIFRLGILFRREEQTKEHFVLRF